MATVAQIKKFIDTVAPLAVAECRRRGYGDAQAWTCVCQSCCETGYGTSALMLKANAFFGIKATSTWKGKVFSSATKECHDGKTYVDITAAFRAYDNCADSVKDYFDFIEGKRYKESLTATTVKDCITIIKNGGYATSPTYINTITTIYEKNKEQIESYKVGNTEKGAEMSVFSPLTTTTYEFGTKKSNPRNQKVCRLTPHHTAGTGSPLTYAKQHRDGAQQASANYYIKDDVILGGVSEDRRAWTSASAANDHKAITIEVSNSTGAPNWKISDKSYKTLVRLCADICKRYGFIPHYDGVNGTITMHKEVCDKRYPTGCPGPYMEDLIRSHKFENDILAEMGKPVTVPEKPTETPKPVQKTKVLFHVQIGAFKNKANAESYAVEIQQKGFSTYVKKEGVYWKVQVGAFADKKNAEAYLKKVEKAGYKGFITVSE